MANVSEYFNASNTTKSNEESMMSEYQNVEENNGTNTTEMHNGQQYNLVPMNENAFEMSGLSQFLPNAPHDGSFVMGDGDSVQKNTSFYSSDELNRQTVCFSPRMGKIPSQYQLESLTEVYFFDVPRLIPSTIPVQKSSVVDESMLHVPLDSSSALIPVTYADSAIFPCTVHSQYISQLLY